MNAVTQEILDTFGQISEIPRCSGNEEAISHWVQQWAADHGLAHQVDSAGNVVIRVPATAGYEEAPTVVIQGHTDMVGQKTPESKHDFKTDPIRLIYDGDWLRADQTTLGADNGLGVAMGLILAKDPNLAHPPLELLYTVDEEVGMSGASALEPDFVAGPDLAERRFRGRGRIHHRVRRGQDHDHHAAAHVRFASGAYQTLHAECNGHEGRSFRRRHRRIQSKRQQDRCARPEQDPSVLRDQPRRLQGWFRRECHPAGSRSHVRG